MLNQEKHDIQRYYILDTLISRSLELVEAARKEQSISLVRHHGSKNLDESNFDIQHKINSLESAIKLYTEFLNEK